MTGPHPLPTTDGESASRYDIYVAQTEPLLRFYGGRGLIKGVNGVGDIDDVSARLRKAALDGGQAAA